MLAELVVGAQLKLPYIHVALHNAYPGSIRQSVQRGFERDYWVQLSGRSPTATLRGAELVITGEVFPRDSKLHGKIPLAWQSPPQAAGITAVAVAGRSRSPEGLLTAGFAQAYRLSARRFISWALVPTTNFLFILDQRQVQAPTPTHDLGGYLDYKMAIGLTGLPLAPLMSSGATTS